MTRALVLGKFYPPHLGHKAMIDFATALAEEVTVFVAGLKSEKISVALRYNALDEHYSGDLGTVRVVCADHDIWQYPSEAPSEQEFWSAWVTYIKGVTGRDKFDYVVGSDSYCLALAVHLDAVWMPFDPDRKMFEQLSATQIRENPISMWKFMLPEMQQRLRKRVVVFGAESCGKTTITRQLASMFDTIWTPEYARGYLEQLGEDVTEAKFGAITTGQWSMEWAANKSPEAGYVIFHDTDLLATKLWYEILMQSLQYTAVKSNIDILAKQSASKTDLYLIMDDNIPFVPDPLRYGDGKRQATTQDCIDLCEKYGAKYVVIRGESKRERFQEAWAHIQTLLKWDL